MSSGSDRTLSLVEPRGELFGGLPEVVIGIDAADGIVDSAVTAVPQRRADLSGRMTEVTPCEVGRHGAGCVVEPSSRLPSTWGRAAERTSSLSGFGDRWSNDKGPAAPGRDANPA